MSRTKAFKKRLDELTEWAKTADWCELASMTIDLEIERHSLFELLTPKQLREYDQLLFLFEHYKSVILNKQSSNQSYASKVASQLNDYMDVGLVDSEEL